jgi:hypothetical protein
MYVGHELFPKLKFMTMNNNQLNYLFTDPNTLCAPIFKEDMGMLDPNAGRHTRA